MKQPLEHGKYYILHIAQARNKLIQKVFGFDDADVDDAEKREDGLIKVVRGTNFFISKNIPWGQQKRIETCSSRVWKENRGQDVGQLTPHTGGITRTGSHEWQLRQSQI